ncbi:MAG: helix-turn-helix transcriptional regulator [Paludibacter sp.]
MNTKEQKPMLKNIDAELDELYGKEGTPQREDFRRDAYAYCAGQVIHEMRKEEKITQQELALRIGANKSYISRIEKGLIEPSVGTFYRIINALGLSIEINKPLA